MSPFGFTLSVLAGGTVGLLRYNVAISLDGCIAGPNGEYDWIPVEPGFDFGALFANFSHFLMGRRTWETLQIMGEADPKEIRALKASAVPVLLGDGVRVIPEGPIHRLKLLETNSLPGGSVQWISAPG